MDYDSFLLTGISCEIAAIVGGGLKMCGIEIPLLRSMQRQVLLGLMGMVLITPAAYSEIKTLIKADECAEYANTALKQHEENLSRKCRQTGERWHDNYAGHFGWCQTQEEESISSETDVRRKILESCG